MMPQLDGVALCRRLRTAEFAHYIYVILLTGKDQIDDLIMALEAGADDFLTKPVNAKELRVRIKAGERVLHLEKALLAKNQELQQANRALEASQQRIRRDLQAAAKIQQDLLPHSQQTGLPIDLAWAFMPADELAGDIFNFYPLDERHLGFYLIDVSGHGIPAAMLSVHLARILSPEPRLDSQARLPPNTLEDTVAVGFSSPGRRRKPEKDPVKVMTRLNENFQADDRNMMYFTMIYGIIDARNGQGSLCQAGHPYPLICRGNGHHEWLGKGGFPVGLIPDADYEAVDFQLQPGDRLLLYSDGVTECFGPQKTPFGEKQLSEILSAARSSSLTAAIEQIKCALIDWNRQSPENKSSMSFSDDISLLAIERCAE
jgi:sigma-B regulation protein RsbU (phosphoserine phosphatase)